MRRKYDIIKQLVSAISELPDDSQGRIFRASVEYLETGIVPQLDMVENTAFRCFKPLFDEVIEDERRLSEKRSNCGKKGGRPKKKMTQKPIPEYIDSNIEKANESKKSNCFSEVENEKRKTERVDKEIFPPITPYKENPERGKEKETTLKGSKEKEPDGLFPPTQKTIENRTKSPEELLVARKEKFRNEILSYSKKYPTDMLESFFSYWSEKNRSETKMRCELEATWELSRRLATWARNDKNFNRKQNTEQTTREPVKYTSVKDLL